MLVRVVLVLGALSGCTALLRAAPPAPGRTVLRATKSEAPPSTPFVSAIPDDQIPGKMVIDPTELAAQSARLDKLSAKWDRQKDLRDWEDSRLTGFSEQAEIINGRTAMFFLVVGLATEYWTGQSIVEQCATMLRITGFLSL